MKLDKSPETIHTMFNAISQKYDLMNKIISFGTQYFIKNKCLKLLNLNPYTKIIDLCCGTGDLSILTQKIQPKSEIIGVDFSEKMLEIAKNKNNKITYIQSDVTNLPFPDNSFDYALMGFGLRNINNTEKAVEEVYRILKPNGLFLHLDFGRKNIFSKIYDKTILFFINFFKKNKSAYRYLIESKKQFLTPKDLIKDFENKGFKLKKREDFLFGIISCQIMQK